MTIAALLDQQLRAAGIPILSVSVGTEADRATWTVQFDPSATAAQRTQAATLVANAVVDASAQTAADANTIDADKRLKAVVLWCAGKFGLTGAQAKAELVAIYKALP
jgi:hypothetical protein